jgi:hypothetical protein
LFNSKQSKNGGYKVDKGTKIVEVTHRNGDRATAKPHRPNSTLFEVCEGPHKGKRGADSVLFDLVGALDWDREYFVIYETGERVRQADFNARPRMSW